MILLFFLLFLMHHHNKLLRFTRLFYVCQHEHGAHFSHLHSSPVDVGDVKGGTWRGLVIPASH